MRLRRHILLCVLVLVAFATLGSAPHAGAAVEKAIWGTDKFHAGHADCPGSPCSAFPVYRQLGVDTYQFQIGWDRVAPTRPANPRNPGDPAYKWPAYIDFDIQQAAAYGINLATLVQGTPPWANGGRAREWAPTNPDDYADFLHAASLRYPAIHRWMIWGEPMYGLNYLPTPPNSRDAPRRYAKLVDAAYKALKGVSQANLVIGGMTLNNGAVSASNWIRWMKMGKGKKRRPPRMDMWGHNPFDARFPNIRNKAIGRFRGLNDIDTLYKELKRAYRGKKKGKGKASAARKRAKVPKLWLSEWTVLSAPSNLFGGFYVSRAEQANYITAAYNMVQNLKYVAGLGWYRIDDNPPTPPYTAEWGLMTYDGARKPAFSAYAAAP